MRSLIGLLWALAGAGAGFVAGAIVVLVIAKITNASNREGALGYAAVAAGIIGALVGVGAALVLYGRSAPAGEGTAFAGSGALGVIALLALVALSIWGFLNLREAPLSYDGAQATLELELRLPTREIPTENVPYWLDVEVQTSKTRPVATLSWSSKRVEGEYTIVPAFQGPLYRSSQRVIAVRVKDRQTEVFLPRMRRTPDPRSDWSEWFTPVSVDPPYGVVPPAPLHSIVALRYRVRKYGE